MRCTTMWQLARWRWRQFHSKWSYSYT